MKKEIAAIYCRLSVEDAEKRAAESESIRNQRALLCRCILSLKDK